MAMLANRTNSIMPIGKSANKNAKSITSIRLVLVVCRVRPRASVLKSRCLVMATNRQLLRFRLCSNVYRYRKTVSRTFRIFFSCSAWFSCWRRVFQCLNLDSWNQPGSFSNLLASNCCGPEKLPNVAFSTTNVLCCLRNRKVFVLEHHSTLSIIPITKQAMGKKGGPKGSRGTNNASPNLRTALFSNSRADRNRTCTPFGTRS